MKRFANAKIFAAAFAISAAWLVLDASAQPAVVEAVQYPAWLERGGRAVPLTPGTPLQDQDKLRTGSNARVLLKMGEGSAVKLGEKAEFVIDRSENRGVFRATLAVLTGAFRYTTEAFAKHRGRDITIRVKNVTAGIRGTDLWGKSGDARDLVCLLEGKISVGAEGHPTVTLDRPLDFYQKAGDAPPEVSRVDAHQVEEWARETEISDEGPAARTGGRWRVIAAHLEQRDPALALVRRLRGAGYPAELLGPVKGVYAVQVSNVAGEPQARALMANLRTVDGVTIPSISETPAKPR